MCGHPPLLTFGFRGPPNGTGPAEQASLAEVSYFLLQTDSELHLRLRLLDLEMHCTIMRVCLGTGPESGLPALALPLLDWQEFPLRAKPFAVVPATRRSPTE